MRRVLKGVVSLVVLALLIWSADAGSIADRLRHADLVWLGIAFATFTAITFLMARRWQIVAAALGIELTFPRALAEYYLAQLINAVLPGGVVGDVGRALRLRGEIDLLRAAQSVAAERVIGQLTMLMLMGVGFVCAMLLPGGVSWPALTWLGIVALIAVLLLAAAVALGLTGLENSTARFLRLILGLMRQARVLHTSLMIAALLIFSFYACARATGTLIPIDNFLTLIPLILTAMLIPLSVGGWGWREGAAAALFPVIDASAGAGIAAGIVYGAMMTLAAFPAVFFWATARDSPAAGRTDPQGATSFPIHRT